MTDLAFSVAELDAVPTGEIRVGCAEDAARWLAYSLVVLVPRAIALERRARRLMFNPFLYFKWKRAQREWDANTERMQAILAAQQRWASSASAILTP